MILWGCYYIYVSVSEVKRMVCLELSDEQLVLCSLCGELLSVQEAVYLKGMLYHPECFKRISKGKFLFDDLIR